MHVEMGKGAKWTLVYQFTQSGAFAEHYAHRYTQASAWAGSGMLTCFLLFLQICIDASIASEERRSTFNVQVVGCYSPGCIDHIH